MVKDADRARSFQTTLCFSTLLLRSIDDGLGETVEAVIRDSKTGPSRHVAFVSTTLTLNQVRVVT